MHRLIENHLEEVLAQGRLPEPVQQHLTECAGCRAEVGAMREHAALLRDWTAPEEVEPRPGFYARVWDRIEMQRPVSIWGLFTDSLWGRRLATASLSLALLMGGYVISSERAMQGVRTGGDPMAERLLSGGNLPLTAAVNSTPNDVFMDLVSYGAR